jgi:hypothetical protein
VDNADVAIRLEIVAIFTFTNIEKNFENTVTEQKGINRNPELKNFAPDGAAVLCYIII